MSFARRTAVLTAVGLVLGFAPAPVHAADSGCGDTIGDFVPDGGSQWAGKLTGGRTDTLKAVFETAAASVSIGDRHYTGTVSFDTGLAWRVTAKSGGTAEFGLTGMVCDDPGGSRVDEITGKATFTGDPGLPSEATFKLRRD